MKKLILSIMIISMLVSPALLMPIKTNAIGYGSPWGELYRDPEKETKHGRAWYESRYKNTCFYIYLETYYSEGSSVSISYYYHPKKTPKKTYKAYVSSSSKSGDSTVTYNKNVKGTFVKAIVKGSAKKFSVNKTYY